MSMYVGANSLFKALVQDDNHREDKYGLQNLW